MTRLFAAALLAAVLLAPAAQAQTIVIVRHAEKVDFPSDPELSPAGRARAQALAESLSGAKLSTLVSTPLKRTRQTGEPAAKAAGAAVVLIPVEGGVAAHAARVAAEARKAAKPGATVLVVGHSNTVPAIAAALGDPAPEPLADCAYDRMTVIGLGGEAPAVLHARYGAASGC